MIGGQTTFEPVYSNVPLSCVPPMRPVVGANGLIDRLWNWSVDSPLFRLNRYVGTRDSSCLQSARLVGPSGRLSHCDEMSAKSPLDFIRPPSEPSKNKPGLFGATTSACWSGWMPCGETEFGWQQLPAGVGLVVASQVSSVNDAPASVEKRTPRPFVEK